MADADSQARQRAVDYVIRLLQMNPAVEGDAIIRARGSSLGAASKSPAAPVAEHTLPPIERRKLVEQLEATRRDFWELSDESLQNQLTALDSQGFADIEAAVARLRFIASQRGEFSTLMNERDFEYAFFESLQDVLVRSPREAAVLKEKLLSAFQNRQRRNSGRRMIRLIANKMPAIFELEADWFNALFSQRSKRERS